jgi:hypothetical protein
MRILVTQARLRALGEVRAARGVAEVERPRQGRRPILVVGERRFLDRGCGPDPEHEKGAQEDQKASERVAASHGIPPSSHAPHGRDRGMMTDPGQPC